MSETTLKEAKGTSIEMETLRDVIESFGFVPDEYLNVRYEFLVPSYWVSYFIPEIRTANRVEIVRRRANDWGYDYSAYYYNEGKLVYDTTLDNNSMTFSFVRLPSPYRYRELK